MGNLPRPSPIYFVLKVCDLATVNPAQVTNLDTVFHDRVELESGAFMAMEQKIHGFAKKHLL